MTRSDDRSESKERRRSRVWARDDGKGRERCPLVQFPFLVPCVGTPKTDWVGRAGLCWHDMAEKRKPPQGSLAAAFVVSY